MDSHAWREVLVNERLTIEESIKAMEDAALRILVVVDDDRSLLGTVTDGDVRRAILRRAGMSQGISSIMNTDPVIGRDWESDEIIRARLEEHDVLHLPILGRDREVVGLRVIQEFFVKKQREN